MAEVEDGSVLSYTFAKTFERALHVSRKVVGENVFLRLSVAPNPFSNCSKHHDVLKKAGIG